MDKSPDAFKTISEVAEELDLPQHVLRFWETRFGQIKPLKRGGGRRYYRPDDVDLLRGIRCFLYDEGYTIKGLQRILKEEGVAFVQAVGRGEIIPGAAPQQLPETLADNRFDPLAAGDLASPGEPRGGQGNLFSPLSERPPEIALSASRTKLLKAILDDLQECERVLAGVKLPA